MAPRPDLDARADRDALPSGRRLRRARAFLRLHRRVLIAVAIAAGIVLMVLHWG